MELTRRASAGRRYTACNTAGEHMFIRDYLTPGNDTLDPGQEEYRYREPESR